MNADSCLGCMCEVNSNKFSEWIKAAYKVGIYDFPKTAAPLTNGNIRLNFSLNVKERRVLCTFCQVKIPSHILHIAIDTCNHAMHTACAIRQIDKYGVTPECKIYCSACNSTNPT